MLSSLRLLNFRNYDDCTVRFSPGLNMLIGPNGQGKTNVLEALYYLSVLRSFRTSQLEHLKQFQREFFMLSCELDSADGEQTVLQVSSGKERRLSVNGVQGIKSVDFITRLNSVPFLPSDLEIVKGSPALRRRFLDILLCSISPAYMRNLQVFNAVLKCRNIMLKDSAKYPRATVKAYDHQLIQSAVAIESSRRQVVERLNKSLEGISPEFFPDGRRIFLKYFPGIDRMHKEYAEDEKGMAEIYAASLDKGYEYDCMNGSTKLGPHHGEMSCLLDKASVTFYGSQGECRSVMLALKFAELEILEQSRGRDHVVVLVDDVLGELDEIRANAFVNRLKTCGQTILAATAVPPGIRPSPGGMHTVMSGRVNSFE